MKTPFKLVAAWLAFSAFARQAWGQSVIVSVPNTDVTKERRLMLAHESQLNVGTYKYPYWNSFSFATLGIGHNIELAATLYGVGSPPSGNIALAAGYKHRIPLAHGSRMEPVMAFGQMFPVSFSGTGVGTWTYGAASFKLAGPGTRFTVGASYGTKQIFGANVVSLFGGVEQPLFGDVSFIVDYFSGNHDLGALVPAIQWNATHAFIVIAGVKVPNSERAGPPAGLVELTYDLDF